MSSKKPKEAKDQVLYLAFGCFIVTSLGNRLFQKLMTIPMYDYPIVINLLSVAAYVPTSFAYVFVVVHCSRVSPITADQMAIPKMRFAVMGGLDCVASLMQILAVNYIPNASTLVLLQQSSIPISMVISRLSFKHVRYDWWQIGGAAVVLAGIGVVLSPHKTTKEHTSWVWPLTIILSCIPACGSSVYKEKALGERDVDVVYLNGWVAVFQTIMSVPMMIPTAYATDLPLDQIPNNLTKGLLCFAGSGSGCRTAPYFVTAFIVFNLAYNVLIIVILKRGSSSLLYLGSTVLVPVSNVMFSFNFVPGHKPLHVADIFGLFIIMLGLVSYRCGAACMAILRKDARLFKMLLFADDDGSDEDEDDQAPMRDYLKMPPAERRSLLAQATTEPPSPLIRESQRTAARHRAQVARAAIARFFGGPFNQLEMLQPLVQAQTLVTKRRLVRSSAQIRHDFLSRLGFSPEPTTARPTTTVVRSPRPHLPYGDLRRAQAARRAAAGASEAKHNPLHRASSFGNTPSL